MELDPLHTLVTILVLLFGVWAQWSKTRIEGRTSEAQIMALVTEAAQDTLEMANEQARKEADKRLAAEALSNSLAAENVELRDSRTSALHELTWYREGVDVLIKQIRGQGEEPEWDPMKTKPLMTDSQIQAKIEEILRQNGLTRSAPRGE
jgi:soluble cytochrome b562